MLATNANRLTVSAPVIIRVLIAILLGTIAAGIEPVHPREWMIVAWQIALGGIVCACVSRFARASVAFSLAPRWIVGASFLGALLLALLSVGVFANSADEYGYCYLADTLLHLRLWNAPPPDATLFRFLYIWSVAGKYFSQYAPGWPLFLAPFQAIGLRQLANPVLTLVMGWALVGALRQFGHTERTTAALAALVLLSPFVLFLGASYYNHMLSGAAIALLCWRQLAEEAAPLAANRVLIGACFSVLLVTRYEVFAIVLTLYFADRLWLRRMAFPRDCLAIAIGALPLTLALLGYDWAITGSPLRLTQGWANPQFSIGLHGVSLEGESGPAASLRHELLWFGGLLEYGGAATVLAYGCALLARLRAMRLRFWDVMLPATAIFFFFFPDSGGLPQYGPRYWFMAWPCVALTIGAALRPGDDFLSLAGTRITVQALAVFQTAVSLGVILTLSVFLRLYIDARREVLTIPPEDRPTIVLIPKREITLGPWQVLPLPADASDFTRNGTDFNGRVLFGIDNRTPDDRSVYEALACKVAGRQVLRWVGAGRTMPVTCHSQP